MLSRDRVKSGTRLHVALCPPMTAFYVFKRSRLAPILNHVGFRTVNPSWFTVFFTIHLLSLNGRMAIRPYDFFYVNPSLILITIARQRSFISDFMCLALFFREKHTWIGV